MNLPTLIYRRAERTLVSIVVSCLSAYGLVLALGVSRFIA